MIVEEGERVRHEEGHIHEKDYDQEGPRLFESRLWVKVDSTSAFEVKATSSLDIIIS